MLAQGALICVNSFPPTQEENFKGRDENLAEWIWKGWVSNLVKLCLLCIFSHCLFAHSFFNTPPTLFFFLLPAVNLPCELLCFKKWKKWWLNVLARTAAQTNLRTCVCLFGDYISLSLSSSRSPAYKLPPSPSHCPPPLPTVAVINGRMYSMCRSIFTHYICFAVCVIISGFALASLRGALPLHQPCVTAPEICICFWGAAGCHLRVIWNARDGRPECSRPILWIFDGLNEQEKYRTKHFVGLLDSRRVRNNGREERMKYWKLCDNSTVRGGRFLHYGVA